MLEREYLIQQALNQFNSQFGHKFTVDEFDVRSIPVRVNFNRSYEVYSIRQDDFLRMHVHFSFGDGDGLSPYRLETDGTQAVGILGDEIFTASGTIAKYHLTTGDMKFHYIGVDESRLPILLKEDGTGLLLENGDYLLLETAA